MFNIFPTARLRPSPFYESTLADGMTTATVYNRMIMPAFYGDKEAEYWRLIKWRFNVGCVGRAPSAAERPGCGQVGADFGAP